MHHAWQEVVSAGIATIARLHFQSVRNVINRGEACAKTYLSECPYSYRHFELKALHTSHDMWHYYVTNTLCMGQYQGDCETQDVLLQVLVRILDRMIKIARRVVL